MPEWTCLVCDPARRHPVRESGVFYRRAARACRNPRGSHDVTVKNTLSSNVADAQQALASALADRGP